MISYFGGLTSLDSAVVCGLRKIYGAPRVTGAASQQKVPLNCHNYPNTSSGVKSSFFGQLALVLKELELNILLA